MNHTEKFIRDAEQGGWKPTNLKGLKYGVIWLDPTAWQAVGKVRGWIGPICPIHSIMIGGKYIQERKTCSNCMKNAPVDRMHGLIDALAKGKTIEAYLSTL